MPWDFADREQSGEHGWVTNPHYESWDTQAADRFSISLCKPFRFIAANRGS